ncbi:MAG: hypothetical protein M3209_17740 [Acidobacteriota bacterium]|nr:hypothetical protein [Acidobacteriota bacterium]
MSTFIFKFRFQFLLVFVFTFCASFDATAQSTVFTYQGRLTNAAAPANGNFDFEFRLCASTDDCATPLAVQQVLNVSVSNGIFTVPLNFGAAGFPGANRFLEITVRPTGNSGEFQQLLPRQPLTSVPEAIRSLSSATSDAATNSQKLGGVAANQFVQTTDARLSDARNPLPGSGNYIQNAATQQTATNFNISGNGTAAGTLSGNIVNATTQYNINGTRVLRMPGTGNIFVGQNAGGSATTPGSFNSFFGESAGSNNASSNNSFFGRLSGSITTTGSSNTFVGFRAGDTNTAGDNNTIIGANTDVASNDLNFATAIGAGAIVSESNSVEMGRSQDKVRIPGQLIVSGNVGIGALSPGAKLDVFGDIYISLRGSGITLKSPDGLVCRSLRISNAGDLVLVGITCP